MKYRTATSEERRHVARLVYGNIEDTRCALRGETDEPLIECAIRQARRMREGRTKTALLERHLRKIRKSNLNLATK